MLLARRRRTIAALRRRPGTPPHSTFSSSKLPVSRRVVCAEKYKPFGGVPGLLLSAGRTPASRRWAAAGKTGLVAEVRAAAGRVPGLGERWAGPVEWRAGPVAPVLPHVAPAARLATGLHSYPRHAPDAARHNAVSDHHAPDRHVAYSGARAEAPASHLGPQRPPPASSTPSSPKLPREGVPHRLEAAAGPGASAGLEPPAPRAPPRRPRGSPAKLETTELGHASLPKPRTLKSLPRNDRGAGLDTPPSGLYFFAQSTRREKINLKAKNVECGGVSNPAQHHLVSGAFQNPG